MNIKSNLSQAIATITAALAFIAAVFVIDERYATSTEVANLRNEMQKKIDTKSDKVLLDTVIQGFIKSTKEQKIRELRREMWQINRKTNLDEADHFLVQDILTDIEMLEEATE